MIPLKRILDSNNKDPEVLSRIQPFGVELDGDFMENSTDKWEDENHHEEYDSVKEVLEVNAKVKAEPSILAKTKEKPSKAKAKPTAKTMGKSAKFNFFKERCVDSERMVAAMVSKAVNAEACQTKRKVTAMMDEANHNNMCHLIDVDTSNTGSSYTLILLPASKKEK